MFVSFLHAIECQVGDVVVLWQSHPDGRFLPVSKTRAHRYFSFRSISIASDSSRPVCDISWSKTDQGFLSTCSSDGYVKVWDSRTSAPSSVLLKVHCVMVAIEIDISEIGRNSCDSFPEIIEMESCESCSFGKCCWKYCQNLGFASTLILTSSLYSNPYRNPNLQLSR